MGNIPRTISTPPSTSLSTVTWPPSLTAILAAWVAWPQPSNPASIWPVWPLSSSMLCFPSRTRLQPSARTTSRSSFATPSGSSSPSPAAVSGAAISTWMLRSAPMAIAVRSTSLHLGPPADKARMEDTGGWPASRSRTAASIESSSNGLRLCFTDAVSIAVCALLTRGLICFPHAPTLDRAGALVHQS